MIDSAVARRVSVAMILSVLLGPTSACRKARTTVSPADLANKVSNRTVQLFFESPQMLLVRESRSVALPENDAAALSPVLRELLKGSANAAVARPFPADAVVRGAFLLPDGTAVVDLGGPTLAAGWNAGSHAELMAIYAVVQTVTANFKDVRRVRLLVNGQPAETLAGHVSLERPLGPRPSLLAK